MDPIIFLNSDLKRNSLFLFPSVVISTSLIKVFFNYAPPPIRISTKKERSNVSIPDLFFLVY